MKLDDFRNIPQSMLWKGSALDQLDSFEKLAAAVKGKLTVVGKHRSKSIDLPVVEITVAENVFRLRDNFYDVNIYARLKLPCQLTISDFFDGIQESRSWAWYLNEIERARSYSWRDFTDGQINGTAAVTSDLLKKKYNTLEALERFQKRLTDPEWYRRDWSSGMITYDGEFMENAKLFIQDHAFGEGMNVSDDVPRAYKQGAQEFFIALPGYHEVELIIRKLI